EYCVAKGELVSCPIFLYPATTDSPHPTHAWAITDLQRSTTMNARFKE
uniref:Uncharacterized protein n=1 Tax=Aegilops tauschii subsp. strangulata TaxID=200361 RepID=A0A453HZI0_AEGTS